VKKSLYVLYSALLVALVASGCSQEPADEMIGTDRDRTTVREEVAPMEPETRDLYPELAAFVEQTVGEFARIPAERRATLGRIAEMVSERTGSEQPARLTFICTHNSRRSHMSQLWAQTAAHVYGVLPVQTYSGGTEATAFNPRAVAAIERAGCRVRQASEAENPVYEVRFSDDGPGMECFSKVYDQKPNPTEGFIAVMTCSAADEACPIVFGADERVAIPFEDPKAFDGTDRESEMYDERCRQIAREMLYVFSQVNVGSATTGRQSP
jgi:protein-tyrosine-phosphatase